jgi:hypothetical protein
MAERKKRKAQKIEPVGVGAPLRKTHPWFDAVARKAKDAAVLQRRKQGRTQGPQLPPEKVVELADELEEIQRQINPLDLKRKGIVEQLLAHWAHTGIEEIDGKLGKTLISLSFELGVNPRIIKNALGDVLWKRVTALTLQPAKLFALSKQPGARLVVQRAARVRKLKVAVTPPSSRRPKSGAPEEEALEETEDLVS